MIPKVLNKSILRGREKGRQLTWISKGGDEEGAECDSKEIPGIVSWTFVD
jgi:hypothetical protein